MQLAEKQQKTPNQAGIQSGHHASHVTLSGDQYTTSQSLIARMRCNTNCGPGKYASDTNNSISATDIAMLLGQIRCLMLTDTALDSEAAAAALACTVGQYTAAMSYEQVRLVCLRQQGCMLAEYTFLYACSAQTAFIFSCMVCGEPLLSMTSSTTT